LFEISRIDKPLARLVRKKKKGRHLSGRPIRNERGDILTNSTDISRIIREYYEQL